MRDAQTDGSLGFVEFDERGNGRWVPNGEVNSDETLIRMLEVDWLELVADDPVEVRRDGYVETYCSRSEVSR